MHIELLFLLGILGVALNPSPYFGALGLIIGAGGGCLMLMAGGVTFLSLVLFLVYLGGMMVVFAYSVALVGEPRPEGWGRWDVVSYVGGYLVVGGMLWFTKLNYQGTVGFSLGGSGVSKEFWGVSVIYGEGGWVLVLGTLVLLLALVGVLEVVWGHYSATLRGGL